MPKTPPEWYLTTEELKRLGEIKAELDTKKRRHAELIEKMKMPHGLNDEEKGVLQKVIREHNALYEEKKQLLGKNPLLPEHFIKNQEEGD